MSACTICGLPVLELNGQFENLDSFFADSDDPALDIAGECHSWCIARSDHGRVWYDWRVQNYSTVRRYKVAGQQDGWTVLLHPRYPQLLALHVNGVSVSGDRAKRIGREKPIDGGLLVDVNEEFNLVLDDQETTSEVAARLEHDGQYPVTSLTKVLGIAERMQWPQALDDSYFAFDKKLKRDWTATRLSVRAQYQTFLPAPVATYWNNLS